MTRAGFYIAKLLVLAVIFKLSISTEVINGENPREFFAVDGEIPQDVPVIILSDNFYEKRSNMNKFKSKFVKDRQWSDFDDFFRKDLMLNKDNVNVMPEVAERDEQMFYIPRVNHAGAGKRAILSYAPRYANFWINF